MRLRFSPGWTDEDQVQFEQLLDQALARRRTSAPPPGLGPSRSAWDWVPFGRWIREHNRALRQAEYSEILADREGPIEQRAGRPNANLNNVLDPGAPVRREVAANIAEQGAELSVQWTASLGIFAVPARLPGMTDVQYAQRIQAVLNDARSSRDSLRALARDAGRAAQRVEEVSRELAVREAQITALENALRAIFQ
jgi:hypothetical protein